MKIHSAFRIFFVLAVACLLITEARKRDCNCGKLGTGTNPCTCSEVVVKAAKVSKPTVFVSPEEINEAAGIRPKDKVTSIVEEKSITLKGGHYHHHHHHHGPGCGCGKNKGEMREGYPKVAPSFPPIGDLCYPLPVDRSGKIIESVTKVTPAYPGKVAGCSCHRNPPAPHEHYYKWVAGQFDGPNGGEVIKEEKIVEADECDTSSGSYDDSKSIVYGSKYTGYGDSSHLGYYGGSSPNMYDGSNSGVYRESTSGMYDGSSSGLYGGSSSGLYGGSSSGLYGGSSSGMYGGSSSGLYGGSSSRLYGGYKSGLYGGYSSGLYGGTGSGLFSSSNNDLYGGSNSGLYRGSSPIIYGGSGSGLYGGSGSSLYGGISSGIYGGSNSGVLGGASGTASPYTDVDSYGPTDSPGCFDNIDEPKTRKPYPDAPADAVSLALAFKSLHPPNVMYKNGMPFVPEDKLSFGHRTVPVEVKYKKKVVDIPEEKLLTVDRPVVELRLSPQQTVMIGSYDEKEEAKLAELEAVERESITKEVSGQVSNNYVSFKDLGYFPENFPYAMRKLDQNSGIVEVIGEEHSGAPCGPMGPPLPGYVPGSVVHYSDVIETEGPKETEEVYVERYAVNEDSEEEEEYDSSTGFFNKLRNIAHKHGSPSCSY